MAYTIIGTDQDDVLEGTEGRNGLFGKEGNDILRGFGGFDLLVGGPGQDTLDGGDGPDTAYYRDMGGFITVTLNGSNDAAVLVYDDYSGEDRHEDTLRNIENIQGSQDSDIITGDSLANYLYGFYGHDTLRGASGDDRLYGHEGYDVMEGGMGDDLVWGHSGNDTLKGDEGNDTLYGDEGRDVLDGGSGQDTATYLGASGSVQITLSGSMVIPVHVNGVIEDHLSNVENITGGRFGDALTGDSQDNHLKGLGGDDALSGGSGDDTLAGGPGDDTSTGGSGADRFMYDSASLGDDVITDFRRTDGDKIYFTSDLEVSIAQQYGNSQADSLISVDLNPDESTAEITVLVKGVSDLTTADILTQVDLL